MERFDINILNLNLFHSLYNCSDTCSLLKSSSFLLYSEKTSSHLTKHSNTNKGTVDKPICNDLSEVSFNAVGAVV